MFAADRRLFPAEVYTRDAFTWAAATVRSRIHAPLDGQQLALVPLADAVSTSGVLVCVKSGEQLFCSYPTRATLRPCSCAVAGHVPACSSSRTLSAL